jgi:mono/diheme cytochrome c family protein
VRAAATAGKRDGEYAASLVLPESGEWTITVHSGFGNSRLSLVPLSAITGGAAAAPPKVSEAERGRRLFVAKGCATCHVHRDAQTTGSLDIGPELSERRFAAPYLGRFLANPAATRAADRPENQATMPDLNLKSGEIAALVSFLNTERQAHRE